MGHKPIVTKVELKPAIFMPPSARPEPALYRQYDSNDRLLYVGISIDPRGRTANHMRGARWFDQVAYITFERGFNDIEALRRAERMAIAGEKPLYNKDR